ncbi:MAG: energy transducer TonB, partial [Candidatus Competibacter sp.]|nr:energy transducer TonB [Candidatus Competibacter sp.]
AAEAKQEAERQAAAEAKRQAEEARKAAAEEARRKAEEDARRKAEEARKLALELAAREAAGNFARSVIQPYVKRQWNPPPNSYSGLSCELLVTVASSGVVTQVRVIRSSGDSLFDNSAMAAVRRASPLPMPGKAEQASILARESLKIKFSPMDSN